MTQNVISYKGLEHLVFFSLGQLLVRVQRCFFEYKNALPFLSYYSYASIHIELFYSLRVKMTLKSRENKRIFRSCSSILVFLSIWLQAGSEQSREEIYQPILIWHGMGDSCDGSMTKINDLIERHVLNARVYCVSTPGIAGDLLGSFWGDISAQINAVCTDISTQEDFKRGYIGIGFSQGGLFMRALVQKCDVPVTKLISIGGPQGGVISLPSCHVPHLSIYCKVMDYIIDSIGFFSVVQRSIVQAQYLYSPTRESPFLEDINGGTTSSNVNGKQCHDYRTRISNLDRMVLFAFTDDTMIEPPESSHFGYYNESTGSIVLLDEQQHLLRCLGLDTLLQRERLELRFIQGRHMEFTMDWFKKQVIEMYLKPPHAET